MITPFNPVQLIDSLDGHVRASYRCQHGGDRPAALSCLLFSGGSILAGGVRTLYSCDIVRPDRKGEPFLTCRGSVTAVIGDEDHSVVGVGLSTGATLFSDLRSREIVTDLAFHQHAVDAIAWSDQKVFTAARLENTVFGFDLRNPLLPEFSVETVRRSSRLISVSAFGQALAVGNEAEPASVVQIDSLVTTRVGEGPTPVIAISRANGAIAVASGSHVLLEGEEEDEVDVSFVPCLSLFSLLPCSAPSIPS
jgi:hypothetical protein